MTPRKRLALWLYGCGAVVFLLDQATKAIVVATLRGRPPIRVIPGVLHLDYTTNTGGAFGLFRGLPWLFFAASVAVVLVILVASTRLASLPGALALGLVLGGALGNLTDRVARGPGVSGKVVDFIDFRIWPVFNVADSAIVVGAVLLAVSGLRGPGGEAGSG